MLGSTHAKNISLDACYGSNHSSAWPSDVYLHLYSGDPTAGSPELVIGTGGYAAITIPNDSTHWPNATGGQKRNALTEAFPVSTGAWSATATYWYLTDAAKGLVAPTSPTVTVTGTGGTTAWQYVITAHNGTGETTASGIGGTTKGNATLSATNYNALAWTSVATATSYSIYRKKGTVFLRIASTVTSTSHHDVGTATVATATPPISNGTMNLLDGGPLTQPVKVLKATYRVLFAPRAIVIAA